jgi:hypothetical protein
LGRDRPFMRRKATSGASSRLKSSLTSPNSARGVGAAAARLRRNWGAAPPTLARTTLMSVGYVVSMASRLKRTARRSRVSDARYGGRFRGLLATRFHPKICSCGLNLRAICVSEQNKNSVVTWSSQFSSCWCRRAATRRPCKRVEHARCIQRSVPALSWWRNRRGSSRDTTILRSGRLGAASSGSDPLQGAGIRLPNERQLRLPPASARAASIRWRQPACRSEWTIGRGSRTTRRWSSTARSC